MGAGFKDKLNLETDDCEKTKGKDRTRYDGNIGIDATFAPECKVPDTDRGCLFRDGTKRQGEQGNRNANSLNRGFPPVDTLSPKQAESQGVEHTANSAANTSDVQNKTGQMSPVETGGILNHNSAISTAAKR